MVGAYFKNSFLLLYTVSAYRKEAPIRKRLLDRTDIINTFRES